MTTTHRILLAFLLLLGAGGWALLTRLEQRVERQYLEAAEEPMVDTAHLLAALLEESLPADGTVPIAAIRRALAAAHARSFEASIYSLRKTAVDLHVYVTDRRGVVLFDSDGGRAEGQDFRARRDVLFTLAGGYGARSTLADPTDDRSSVMYVGAPLRHRGETIGVVSVAKPQGAMRTFIAETRRWLRSLALTGFGAMAAGAVLLTAVFSRPVARLTRYARAVARGERVTLQRSTSPELATLGQAFEEMRDALENRQYVERYVQTLTHEMKSPVAAIRGAAELLREPLPAERRERFLDNIQAEARRLQHVIDRLLALAALENRRRLENPAQLSLARVAERVCAGLQPAAEAQGVRLECDAGSDEATVCGEEFLLESALGNLVQNALEFSPPGGCVRVAVSAGPERCEVRVEDEGPGVPAFALPRVWERFYSLQRPRTGRKSSGLGLCYAQEAAQLHGGSVELVNREPGPGARALLRLPRETSRV